MAWPRRGSPSNSGSPTCARCAVRSTSIRRSKRVVFTWGANDSGRAAGEPLAELLAHDQRHVAIYGHRIGVNRLVEDRRCVRLDRGLRRQPRTLVVVALEALAVDHLL